MHEIAIIKAYINHIKSEYEQKSANFLEKLAKQKRDEQGISSLITKSKFQRLKELLSALKVTNFSAENSVMFNESLRKLDLYLADTMQLGKPFLDELLNILNTYNESDIIKYPFNFIRDEKLKRILQRDFLELNDKLFPANAWKSALVMAGSILEAILLDVLTNHECKTKVNAKSTLEQLINVAIQLDLLPTTSFDPKTIHVLRKYRNLIHPKEEKRASYTCGKSEAKLATGVLEIVYEHFEKN